jgi:hypothetical protein
VAEGLKQFLGQRVSQLKHLLARPPDLFDMDGTGSLAKLELARLLRSRGLCPTADESLVVTGDLNS